MRYGNYSYDNGNENRGKYAESFGFEFRLYFGATVEEVALQPIVRLAYNGALGKQHNIKLLTALGLTANSDIVSIYLETTLGLKVNQDGSATDKNVKEVYGLGYGVYAEIYISL